MRRGMRGERWLGVCALAVASGLVVGVLPAPAGPVHKVQDKIELKKDCDAAAATVATACGAKGKEHYDAGMKKLDDAAPLVQNNTGQALALTEGAERDFNKTVKACDEQKDKSKDTRPKVVSCVGFATAETQDLKRYLTKVEELGRQPGAR